MFRRQEMRSPLGSPYVFKIMNRYVRNFLVVLLLLSMGTYSCELDKVDPCPCIKSIEPGTARSGEDITLTGEFVNYDSARDRITVDGIVVQPEDFFGNQIRLKIPNGISSEKVPVSLSIEGCNSDGLENCKGLFDYKKVTVSGFSTANPEPTGQKEDTVRITGNNFRSEDFDLNKVMFGNVPADNIVMVSESQIVLLVPKGADTGNLTVSVDGFEANAGEFTYLYSKVSDEAIGLSSPNFISPVGISTDAEGNIFVADEGANQIFKIAAINGLKETFAGNPFGFSGDNPGEVSRADSRFYSPWDIVMDQDEIKYVADFGNKKLRRIVTDRVFNIIELVEGPISVAVNQSKDLFFTDGSNTIKMLPNDSMAVQDFASNLNKPTGLFMAENGNLYVADTENHKIKYIEAQTGNIVDVAGNGNEDLADGPADEASFDNPKDILVDDRDNVFVADSGNHIVRVITPTGYVYTLAFGFNEPNAIAVYETLQELALYVADTQNNRVMKIVYE